MLPESMAPFWQTLANTVKNTVAALTPFSGRKRSRAEVDLEDSRGNARSTDSQLGSRKLPTSPAGLAASQGPAAMALPVKDQTLPVPAAAQMEKNANPRPSITQTTALLSDKLREIKFQLQIPASKTSEELQPPHPPPEAPASAAVPIHIQQPVLPAVLGQKVSAMQQQPVMSSQPPAQAPVHHPGHVSAVKPRQLHNQFERVSGAGSKPLVPNGFASAVRPSKPPPLWKAGAEFRGINGRPIPRPKASAMEFFPTHMAAHTCTRAPEQCEHMLPQSTPPHCADTLRIARVCTHACTHVPKLLHNSTHTQQDPLAAACTCSGAHTHTHTHYTHTTSHRLLVWSCMRPWLKSAWSTRRGSCRLGRPHQPRSAKQPAARRWWSLISRPTLITRKLSRTCRRARCVCVCVRARVCVCLCVFVCACTRACACVWWWWWSIRLSGSPAERAGEQDGGCRALVLVVARACA